MFLFACLCLDGSVASRHVLNLHLIFELLYLVSFLLDCVWMAQSPVAGRRVLNLQLISELFYLVSFLPDCVWMAQSPVAVY